MALWTSGRWAFTRHRVVTPPTRHWPRRQSLALFRQPNWHREIACIASCLVPAETPRHQPVLSDRS